MAKNTDYLFFCEHCSLPQKIPHYVIQTYFSIEGVPGVYCEHCKELMTIPAYLRKIAKEL
jgi:hypothetical protein